MNLSGTEKRSLLLGLGLTGLMLVLRLGGMLEGLSLSGLDFLYDWRGPVKPENPIVIVAMDNESFNEMGIWPWPRDFHARLLRTISRGKPKVVVFDVLFTESSGANPDLDGWGKAEKRLAAECRRAGNVVLGAELVNVRDELYQYEELKLPIKLLHDAIYSSGIVNTPKDADTFVRRAKLVWLIQDERHYSLALAALRKYLSVGQGEIDIEPGTLVFGDRRIPLDHQYRMMINYRGPPKTFKTIPYYQVFSGMIDPAVFKDAIVLIGATAESLHDTFNTPFTRGSAVDSRHATMMPGVEIHANAIETIITEQFITVPSVLSVVSMSIVVQVVLGLLVSLLAIRARIWVGLLVSVVAAGVLLATSVSLFTEKLQYLEFVYPLLTMGLVSLGCTTYRASVEMREKQRVRETFARYVSPHVLTTVLSNPPELGGVRRNATVLFSDVRGFTSMSEKLTAHEVVEILNEYLTEMVAEVLDHDGTLDKFVGDAIMAVFGSPMDQPDHALRAVSTAWRMGQRHNDLKAKWISEGKVPFEIGIGVNTGDLVAGNMGSPNRMEFTVIGDNVNLAARLESATKEVGAKILISGSTYEIVKDHVSVREHPPIQVKGKEKPILVYELTGMKDETTASLVKRRT